MKSFRKNTKMLKWWINEIDFLIFLIKNNKPFPNYYYESLYNALEEYYYLKEVKNEYEKNVYWR